MTARGRAIPRLALRRLCIRSATISESSRSAASAAGRFLRLALSSSGPPILTYAQSMLRSTTRPISRHPSKIASAAKDTVSARPLYARGLAAHAASKPHDSSMPLVHPIRQQLPGASVAPLHEQAHGASPFIKRMKRKRKKAYHHDRCRNLRVSLRHPCESRGPGHLGLCSRCRRMDSASCPEKSTILVIAHFCERHCANTSE
jgi:hypothetical protein